MSTKTVFRRIDYGVCYRCHQPASVLRVKYKQTTRGIKSAQLTTCCEKHSGKAKV